MKDTERRELLEGVVRDFHPIAEARALLRNAIWDVPEPLVKLSQSDLAALLDQFTAGRLSAQYLEDWADFLEVREDILTCSDLVQQFLFEVSTPELFGPITPERAAAWRSQMEN